MKQWPEWWNWELELSPHLLKRMVERDFTEVELRKMLKTASDFRADYLEGRWVFMTRHNKKRWEVVVEPDPDDKLLVVVTAFPIE